MCSRRQRSWTSTESRSEWGRVQRRLTTHSTIYHQHGLTITQPYCSESNKPEKTRPMLPSTAFIRSIPLHHPDELDSFPPPSIPSTFASSQGFKLTKIYIPPTTELLFVKIEKTKELKPPCCLVKELERKMVLGWLMLLLFELTDVNYRD